MKEKKKTKQTASNCNYNVASQKEITQFLEVEPTNINPDKFTHETYRQKNELEACIYLLKD
jgi:molecular chaperone DnaK (HSP70)